MLTSIVARSRIRAGIVAVALLLVSGIASCAVYLAATTTSPSPSPSPSPAKNFSAKLFAPLPASPTSNLLGINIAAPQDGAEDRLYADLIPASRDFKSGWDVNNPTMAPVDSQGWPTSDFSFYVWATIANMHGIYTLSFKGQATVSGSSIGSINLSYDPTTNVSSGTFQATNATSASILSLSFTNTKRTASSATGSGVTAIKLMRPLTPGASQSYPATTRFADPAKALVAKFSVVRFMDFLATNANVQTNWSDRALPSAASFNRNPGNAYGWQGLGGPWEHVILFLNETGKDGWINLPMRASDAYIRNVALMFAYGSDGVNPYTSPQTNPVYPPLKANLKVYVEHSNELWNFGSAFTQSVDNCQAASDELVRTAGSSALNWDKSWNNVTYPNGGWNWGMCHRLATKRGVEVSTIFRSVFGDGAMMTRIRPVFMTQLGNAGAMLSTGAQMLLGYYNNMSGNHVATPHAPNYYFYGAGGSGYYYPDHSVSTLDGLFADSGMTAAGFKPGLQGDAGLVAALGLKRVAYEGGPSLDRTGGVRDGVAVQTVNDARMTQTLVSMHDEWSRNGGELLVYYQATGDYQWGFTADAYNLSTPKFKAIDALNAAPHAALTVGTLVPGNVAGNSPNVCSRGWGCNPMQPWDYFTADGSKITWTSYPFRSTAAAVWTVNLTFSNATNASVALYVDGMLVGTQPTSGGALSFTTGMMNPGLHGVIVRAVGGSFSVSSVAVN